MRADASSGVQKTNTGSRGSVHGQRERESWRVTRGGGVASPRRTDRLPLTTARLVSFTLRAHAAPAGRPSRGRRSCCIVGPRHGNRGQKGKGQGERRQRWNTIKPKHGPFFSPPRSERAHRLLSSSSYRQGERESISPPQRLRKTLCKQRSPEEPQIERHNRPLFALRLKVSHRAALCFSCTAGS